MAAELNLERLIGVYMKMRAKRTLLKEAFEKEDGDIEAKQNQIKAVLAEHCKEHNVENGRTTAGSFYRKVVAKYWTNDWDSMGKFIVENNVPDLLERRLNQTNTREFLKEHPDLLPPGLNVDSKYEIVISEPKKGE